MVTRDDDSADNDLTYRLEDSCAHCSKPISAEIRNRQVTLLEPETVWVQQGGG